MTGATECHPLRAGSARYKTVGPWGAVSDGTIPVKGIPSLQGRCIAHISSGRPEEV